MDIATATALVATLTRTTLGLASGGRLRMHAKVEGDRVVFTGGRYGDASIFIDVSSEERVLAHWEGYLNANGCALLPRENDIVEFPSASAWRAGGYRRGRVISCGPKRVRIAYEFKHGGKATTRIAIKDLRF